MSKYDILENIKDDIEAVLDKALADNIIEGWDVPFIDHYTDEEIDGVLDRTATLLGKEESVYAIAYLFGRLLETGKVQAVIRKNHETETEIKLNDIWLEGKALKAFGEGWGLTMFMLP
jgi:hypothetical protein